MGEGRRRGIESVGFESLVVVEGGVRVGWPAREAWIVEEAVWRWVPGPGV